MSLDSRKPNNLWLIISFDTLFEMYCQRYKSSMDYMDFLSIFYTGNFNQDFNKAIASVGNYYKKIKSMVNGELPSECIKNGIELGNLLRDIMRPPPDRIIWARDSNSLQTLRAFIKGWGKSIKSASLCQENSLRSLNTGLVKSCYNNDLNFFLACNPEQKKTYDTDGFYDYVYPNGNSIAEMENIETDYYYRMCQEYSSQNLIVFAKKFTVAMMMTIIQGNTGPKAFERILSKIGGGGSYIHYKSEFGETKLHKHWELEDAKDMII